MSTKYTYFEVMSYFQSKNCILLDKTYVNQLTKINYIASCGHTNCVEFKRFLTGKSLKCRNCALEMPTYESVCDEFKNKNCIILNSKEEFTENYKNNCFKFKYIANCGHNNSVSYKNFKTLNQGINCPECVNKNTSQILKNLRSGENKLGGLEQEYKCIQYFTEKINTQYDVIKSYEGCKSDIIIKPRGVNDNFWLGIQVKSTHKKSKLNQYFFRLNGNSYENCILLCICEEDKNMWLIPYNDIDVKKTIGIANKSKYNKYQVTTDTIFEKLKYFYNNIRNWVVLFFF